MLQKLTLLSLSLVCVAINAPAHADAKLEINSDAQLATLFIKDNRLLMRSKDNQSTVEAGNVSASEAIYDDNEKTLYIIDHQDRSIFPLNQQSISQLSAVINSAANVMQEQMKSLPPEQQEQMKQTMKSLGLTLPETTTTPEVKLGAVTKKTHRGIECNERLLIEGEQQIGRVCISNGNSLSLSNTDYQNLLNAQAFFLSLAKEAQQVMQGYGQQLPNFGDLELDGILINTQQLAEANSDNVQANNQHSFEIISIEQTEVNTIALPEGYETKSLLDARP